MYRSLIFLALLLPLFTKGISAQQRLTLTASDGATIAADLYGSGPRGVVLAHGGQFTKESWAPQARELAGAGFHVLAIDFRGFGGSHGPGEKDFDHAPFALDVLAAVDYLRSHGARTVAVVGGSFGGSAAGDASILSPPGKIDRVVMLGGAPNEPAEKLHCATLWIVARDDTSGDGPRLPGIQKQYDKAPEPKKLIVLDGSAHAQFLFQTDQGERVMREILRFLTAK